FWQWNRYTPNPTTNAAMRDGRWKLIRPAALETLMVRPDDLAVDEDVKHHPEAYPDIDRFLAQPLPDPAAAITPVALQLYDIEADPTESRDLAPEEPGRVARMEA